MIKKICLLVVLSFLSLSAFSQTEIYGTWEVHCALEQSGNKSVTFCDLCSTSATDSSVKIEGFEMTIDSTHIQFGESKDKITYVKRPNTKGITFVKNRTPYGFDILTTTSSDHVILRSSKGLILILHRQLESEAVAESEE